MKIKELFKILSNYNINDDITISCYDGTLGRRLEFRELEGSYRSDNKSIKVLVGGSND